MRKYLIFNLIEFFLWGYLSLYCYEKRTWKMVDGYRKVYHDRSRTDLHFRRILPKMDNRGLYLLKDNSRNKKKIR